MDQRRLAQLESGLEELQEQEMRRRVRRIERAAMRDAEQPEDSNPGESRTDQEPAPEQNPAPDQGGVLVGYDATE